MIEVELTGEGPDVLMLHGAAGGFDQGTWTAHALGLRGHRVIAVSRPAYLGTPDAGTIDDEVDLYAAALDALDVERAFVIGVSAGGMSASQFARRHPERVTRLVMLSAVSGPVTGLGLALIPYAMRASADANRSFIVAIRTPWGRRLFAELARTQGSPERRFGGLARDIRISRTFLPPEGITVASLIVHGTADANVPFAHAERTARGCTRGTLLPIDGGRHLCVMTHPEVGGRVREFLAAA